MIHCYFSEVWIPRNSVILLAPDSYIVQNESNPSYPTGLLHVSLPSLTNAQPATALIRCCPDRNCQQEGGHVLTFTVSLLFWKEHCTHKWLSRHHLVSSSTIANNPISHILIFTLSVNLVSSEYLPHILDYLATVSSQILLSRAIRSAPSSTSVSEVSNAFNDRSRSTNIEQSIPDKEPMNDGDSSTAPTNEGSSTTLPSDVPPHFVSPAMGYPRELIQHIYSYLHPRDFNAARHTCQSWMTASLDKGLLTTMLKRAGWSTRDENHIWGMSCRLARECALSSGWTGNGIIDPPRISPFRQSAWVDFSELASGYTPSTGRNHNGLVFTVSVCGKYLLVAEGGMIYVYELLGNTLRVLTSVVCPRKVLAMSMDASSRRFAVAALLDGRMGLMCDLRIHRPSAGTCFANSPDRFQSTSFFFPSQPLQWVHQPIPCPSLFRP